MNIVSPFRELNSKNTLESLIDYLIEEVQSNNLDIWLPFDQPMNTIHDLSIKIVPLKIVLGSINYTDIMSFAPEIRKKITLSIEHFHKKIPSNQQKAHFLNKLIAKVKQIKEISFVFNPIRFASEIKVYAVNHIDRFESNLGRFDLNSDDWKDIRLEFQYRYFLLEDIERILQIELKKIIGFEFPEPVYKWSGKEIEIIELALALSYMNKVESLQSKSDDDFIRDFLAFFRVPYHNLGKHRGNILKRKKPENNFLDALKETLIKRQEFVNEIPKRKKRDSGSQN